MIKLGKEHPFWHINVNETHCVSFWLAIKSKRDFEIDAFAKYDRNVLRFEGHDDRIIGAYRITLLVFEWEYSPNNPPSCGMLIYNAIGN